MIPRTTTACQTPHWQRLLARGFRRTRDLLDYLAIDPGRIPGYQAAERDFGLRVPVAYADLMERGNPRDPLLHQVLPRAEELREQPGFVSDPVADLDRLQGNGVIGKYRGRLLLITTGACAVHCRYCFRRHYPYAESGPRQWQEAVDLIGRSADTEEVILSGGDPLMLSDPRLSQLFELLAKIPHLKRLRLHSRLPALLPERLTETLRQALCGLPQRIILVLHVNHPREVTQRLAMALAPLRRDGITLLNQSVLLRGVNDSAPTLQRLSEALFEAGILPYYLHQLDPVQGAAHFAVSASRAMTLHQALRDTLPGYLVPRLVQELPGAASKIPLAPTIPTDGAR